MGSQAVFNALVEAPKAIVVKTETGSFAVAVPVKAVQPNRSHGGIGPVVLVYGVDDSLLFAAEKDAIVDAASRML